LRESYREGDKIKNRMLANLACGKVEALRCVLREDAVAPTSQDGLTRRAACHTRPGRDEYQVGIGNRFREWS